MLQEIEQKIAERQRQSGEKAKDTDRRIAVLVRAWKSMGGRLKIVD